MCARYACPQHAPERKHATPYITDLPPNACLLHEGLAGVDNRACCAPAQMHANRNATKAKWAWLTCESFGLQQKQAHADALNAPAERASTQFTARQVDQQGHLQATAPSDWARSNTRSQRGSQLCRRPGPPPARPQCTPAGRPRASYVPQALTRSHRAMRCSDRQRCYTVPKVRGCSPLPCSATRGRTGSSLTRCQRGHPCSPELLQAAGKQPAWPPAPARRTKNA